MPSFDNLAEQYLVPYANKAGAERYLHQIVMDLKGDSGQWCHKCGEHLSAMMATKSGIFIVHAPVMQHPTFYTEASWPQITLEATYQRAELCDM